MQLKDQFQAFVDLLNQGKSIVAIERFFEEDIQQYENNNLSISGKTKALEIEQQNLDRVHDFKVEFRNVGIDEDKGFVWGEMILSFTSIKSGAMRLEEAFFQQWNNGKIKTQKFFYKEIVKA